MKIRNSILIALFCPMLFSCDLVQPDDIVNPNVDEDTFLNTPNAMATWVNGVKKNFAQAIGTFCLHTEIMTDNYYNNYTRESKVFDIPQLLYTDPDIATLQRYVGNLREAANYGLGKVREHDASTTREQLFTLLYIRAYAFILAGENFRALPIADGGEAKPWNEQLKLALQALDEAAEYADTDADKAFVHTLKARTHYRLGHAEEAANEAQAALNLSEDFIRQVTFDGENGISNAIQDDIWHTMYQPLPRLDFLDPKYFQLTSTDEQPICIAKAEENYLILAEAALAKGAVANAKKHLRELHALVKKRPVQHMLNDQLEGRYNGGFKHYPNSADYVVAASKGEPYRSGLVLSRQAPHLIDVPTVSGTSVDIGMIDNCTSVDQTLELVYLMRQEIFIAEGRRLADLGIRLPLCEVEAANNTASADYTQAYIPAFIPLEQGLDAFEINEQTKQVTIKHNMNKEIVAHKSEKDVAPFFSAK
ncbi:MAG TPA: hypothetical protein VIQ97_01260 [Prevotella sp.]